MVLGLLLPLISAPRATVLSVCPGAVFVQSIHTFSKAPVQGVASLDPCVDLKCVVGEGP